MNDIDRQYIELVEHIRFENSNLEQIKKSISPIN